MPAWRVRLPEEAAGLRCAAALAWPSAVPRLATHPITRINRLSGTCAGWASRLEALRRFLSPPFDPGVEPATRSLARSIESWHATSGG